MGNNNGYQWGHSVRHAVIIAAVSFGLAVVISVGSGFFLSKIASILLSFGLLLLLITIGILFDILGIATAAANEEPFHAKAAKKVSGSYQAIWLVRNADRVANFFNDVIGDISAATAGALGASIAFRLAQLPGMEGITWSVWMTGLVAGITVGGKALGKTLAIRRSNELVFGVAIIISRIEQITGLSFFQLRRKKKVAR